MSSREPRSPKGHFYWRAFLWLGTGPAVFMVCLALVIGIFSEEGAPLYEAATIPGAIALAGWIFLTPIFGILAWLHRGKKIQEPMRDMLVK
jgi:hypothetical protein